MLVSEVNKELVGKKVSFNFTGLRSTGIVTEIYEDEYLKGIVVKFDSPINWGGDFYEKSTFTARKFDNFGSLSHTFIIPNQGDLVEFEYNSEYKKVEKFVGYFESFSSLNMFIDLCLNLDTKVLNEGEETFNIHRINSLKLVSKETKEILKNEIAEYINC